MEKVENVCAAYVCSITVFNVFKNLLNHSTIDEYPCLSRSPQTKSILGFNQWPNYKFCMQRLQNMVIAIELHESRSLIELNVNG